MMAQTTTPRPHIRPSSVNETGSVSPLAPHLTVWLHCSRRSHARPCGPIARRPPSCAAAGTRCKKQAAGRRQQAAGSSRSIGEERSAQPSAGQDLDQLDELGFRAAGKNFSRAAIRAVLSLAPGERRGRQGGRGGGGHSAAHRYLSSPNSLWRTSMTERMVSRPIMSQSARGPMGWLAPSFMQRSMSDGEATPSAQQHTPYTYIIVFYVHLWIHSFMRTASAKRPRPPPARRISSPWQSIWVCV
jgi:hypothetical protein